jgi:hypothetical protein
LFFDSDVASRYRPSKLTKFVRRGQSAGVTQLSKAEVKRLFVAKLAASGLSPQDGSKLRMRPLTAVDVTKLGPGYDARAGILIPYFSARGAVDAKFFRLRYLQPPTGFAGLGKKERHKYTQPRGSPPRAYLPPLVRWSTLLGDVETPLVLTEGELKAAAATRAGFPTIGLGGVWNFKSKRAGTTFISDLAAFTWAERVAFIVFDSDVHANPQVRAALAELATALIERGAEPRVALLPDLDGLAKTGLDDLLVARGADALDQILADAEPFGAAAKLHALNEEVAYVRDPGLIVEVGSGLRIAPRAFVEHAYATRHYDVTETTKKGNVRVRRESLARAWLRWPFRTELARVTFRPGASRVTDGAEYNLWRGWGVDAEAKGDLALFEALLDHVFGDDRAARTWFLRWAAYQVQHPGTKLYTAVVVWSAHHGVGKSLLGYTLGKLFGPHFHELTQQELQSNFNSWAMACQFAMADEVIASDRRRDSEKIKNLITQASLTVNQKYVPTFSIPDLINYYFTSNHPDAFHVERTDRRFFVWELAAEPLDDAFYARYHAWLHDDPAGPAALLYHLRRYDLGDFNPRAPALGTVAKEEMQYHSASNLEVWLTALKRTPDEVLSLNGQPLRSDLWTPDQLLALYDPDGRYRIGVSSFAKAMRRMGFVPAPVRIVRTKLGTKRLYVVRDPLRWRAAKSKQLAAHYEAAFSETERGF